jgi:hypothetical protein
MSGANKQQSTEPSTIKWANAKAFLDRLRKIPLGIVFWFLVLVLILGLFSYQSIGQWGKVICPAVRDICHEVPYLFGFALLLILWASYRFLSGEWTVLETVRGLDNRWSTSKCQFFLWTVVAFFAYGSVLAGRIGIGLPPTKGFYVPQNLLLAMGLSVTTVLAAKGITVGQQSTQPKDNVDTKDASIGDLVKDDGGGIDLTKVQMLGWTFIAVGAYLANVVRAVQNLAPNSPLAEQLPDIDTALMVLMGLGQGAYLVKKAIINVTPTILNIDPNRSPSSGTITIIGTSFGTTQLTGSVAIVGLPGAVAVQSWSDKEIKAALPALSPCPIRIRVTVNNQDSNSYPIMIV